MHRNTFLEVPEPLQPTLQFRRRERLLAAGQITGTEGYAAAAAGGWLASTNAAGWPGTAPIDLPTCMIGALTHFISEVPSGKFQPMPPNFGLLLRCRNGFGIKGDAMGLPGQSSSVSTASNGEARPRSCPSGLRIVD